MDSGCTPGGFDETERIRHILVECRGGTLQACRGSIGESGKPARRLRCGLELIGLADWSSVVLALRPAPRLAQLRYGRSPVTPERADEELVEGQSDANHGRLQRGNRSAQLGISTFLRRLHRHHTQRLTDVPSSVTQTRNL